MFKTLFGKKKHVAVQHKESAPIPVPVPSAVQVSHKPIVVTPLQITIEIAIPDLAEAMEYYREQMLPELLVRDYWNLVIQRATKGKAWLSEDQRPQLKAWMDQNSDLLVNRKTPEDSRKVLDQLLEVL